MILKLNFALNSKFDVVEEVEQEINPIGNQIQDSVESKFVIVFHN